MAGSNLQLASAAGGRVPSETLGNFLLRSAMFSPATAGIHAFAAIVLCWLGICLCIYIGASDHTAFCSNTGDCNTVVHSRFARFYGIPLPSIGIGFYSSLLVILLFSWATSRDDLRTLS